MEPASAVDCSPLASPKRRRRSYKRHGFYTLKTTLRALGPRVIDRRTSIGKALAEWRDVLVRDLGGASALSMQQSALVDLLVRQKVLLESIDAWLLVQPSLVNARKRALLPVVRERQVVADAMSKYLGQLGLERRAKPVEDLGAYMKRRDAEKVPV